MIKAKSMTDEQLFELVRESYPLSESASIKDDAGAARLVRYILTTERDPMPTKPSLRLPGTGVRVRLLVGLLGTTGAVAGAVVAAVLLFTAGSSPSIAFAGWSASPTSPSSGQIAAAEAACLARMPVFIERAEQVRQAREARERGATEDGASGSASQTATLPAANSGEWHTVLTDTRGPFTAVILETATSQGSIACFSGPPSGAHPFGFASGTEQGPVSDSEIRLTSLGWRSDGHPGQGISDVEGRTGRGVTGVTVILQDGTRVEATVANGWLLAWWPGEQQAVNAEITTPTGVSTQQLQLG